MLFFALEQHPQADCVSLSTREQVELGVCLCVCQRTSGSISCPVRLPVRQHIFTLSPPSHTKVFCVRVVARSLLLLLGQSLGRPRPSFDACARWSAAAALPLSFVRSLAGSFVRSLARSARKPDRHGERKPAQPAIHPARHSPHHCRRLCQALSRIRLCVR